MNRFLFTLSAVLLLTGAEASWYWPFGDDEDEPPRLSELIEQASLMIGDASHLAAEGKVTEAVRKYQEALQELDRVERENPERAKTTEFATVKTKRAYVEAAIDALLMNQARQNAKSVAVSDTSALERRLVSERAANALSASDLRQLDAIAGDLLAKDPRDEEAAVLRELRKPAELLAEAGELLNARKMKAAVVKYVAATNALGEVARNHPKWNGRSELEVVRAKASGMGAAVEGYLKGLARKREGVAAPLTKREEVMKALGERDFAKADRLIAELLEAKPNDAAALNLRAAREVAEGKYDAAEKTLDSAMRSNPRDYFAYYNMAMLKLRTRADDRDGARRYYESGRALGGPRNEPIEEMLK